MKITNLYKNCAGEGVQLDISFAGCEHHCKGCYVPELWDPAMYPDWTPEYIFREIGKLERNIDRFVLLGGDPLFEDNIQDTIELIRHLQRYKKPIVLMTGYTQQEILRDKRRTDAFNLADVVVTGRYQKRKRTKQGSSNQRTFGR